MNKSFLFILLIIFLFFIIGIFPDYHKVLHTGIVWKILFSCKFGSFILANENGCFMNLEPSYGFWLTCGSNVINSLSNFHRYLDILKFIIESHEHSWVHGKDEIIQEIMILATDESFHISGSIKNCKDASKADIWEQEFSWVHWWESKHSLAHVHKTLWNTNDKENIRGSGVVLCKISKGSWNTGIIGSGTD